MALNTNQSIKDTIASLQKLPGATMGAVKDSMDFYGRYLLKQHFERGNASKYRYPALSPKYKKYKSRTVGNKPQLVFNGALKRKVLKNVKAKIRKNGNVSYVYLRLKFPRYGFYQLEKGRDFIRPNRRDVKMIMNRLRNRIAKRRAKQVKRSSLRPK